MNVGDTHTKCVPHFTPRVQLGKVPFESLSLCLRLSSLGYLYPDSDPVGRISLKALWLPFDFRL